MASAGVNVLRWSALGLGVLYGAYHQMSLSAKDHAAHVKAEYDAKAKLIAEAKAEFNKQKNPQSVTSAVKSEGKGFDFTSDTSGADFDLEALLHMKDGQ